MLIRNGIAILALLYVLAIAIELERIQEEERIQIFADQAKHEIYRKSNGLKIAKHSGICFAK
jgi:hypothetical protein